MELIIRQASKAIKSALDYFLHPGGISQDFLSLMRQCHNIFDPFYMVKNLYMSPMSVLLTMLTCCLCNC